MNFKKLALIGIIALIVIGFVAVAGCTSSNNTPSTPSSLESSTSLPTTSSTSSPVAAGSDIIIGKWGYDTEVMIQLMKKMAIAFGASEDQIDLDEIRSNIPSIVYLFNADGTGKAIMDGVDDEAKFTWKSLGDNKYTMIDLTGEESEISYSPETGIISDISGLMALKKLLE